MDREQQIQRLVDHGFTRERAAQLVDARLAARDATAQAPRAGGRTKTYSWGDVARTAAQGATFGFGDEIEAAVTGKPVEEIRQGIQNYRDEAGGRAFLTEMAGGLIPGIGFASQVARGGNAARQAGFGSQVLRGATAGGAAGAAYGVGAGETSGARVTGGLVGGVTGTAVGAATPFVAAGLQRVGSAVKNAPVIREGLEAIDERAWLPKFLKPTSPDEVADRLVLRAMAMDGFDEDEVAALIERGEPIERIVDMLGENTRRTARGAASIQNSSLTEATDFLRDRADGEASRISALLTDLLGAEDVNVQRVREGIQAGMRARAKGLYDEAYEAAYTPSAEVQRILNQPGIRSIAREHNAMVRSFSAEAPDMFQFNYNPSGGVVELSPRASVRSLDSLKRALDDQISAAYKAGEGTKAAMLREYRDAIRSDLRDKVPAYRRALDQYAGDRAVEDAFEAGTSTTLGTRKVDEVVAMMEDMSDAEREMFRLGFVNNLRTQIGRNDLGRDVARSVIGVNPRGGVRQNTRELFEAMFPDKNTEDLFAALQGEARMTESANAVLSGSRTASVQADQLDLLNADPAERVLTQLLRRGPRAGLDELGDQLQESRWGQVSGLVLDRTVLQPPQQAFADMVARTGQREAVESLLRPARFRAGGSLVGGLLSGYAGSGVGNSLFPTRR